MNIVEFALKFKDLASSELGKFGAQAKRTFDNAGKLTNDLTGKNKILGSSYDVLQQKIKQVESVIRTSTIPSQIREARRELAALQRQSVRHIGNISGGKSDSGMGGVLGLAGLGKFAGPAAIVGVGLMAGQFFGESFNKGLERQQIQTSFNVLTGSAKAGQELSGQLVKYAKDTVLGPEVFKDAQTMMGFGFKSTEVMPNLKMLGDVSMGNSQKLESLTLAFSQTRAAGKLMGQDLLQYISAGFNPMEEISKRTGKSMGQMRKEMEGGNISFAMVQQAFKDATGEGGKFNKMLETIAQTPAGKMQALTGTWNEFKVSAGTAFMPLVSMALDFATKLLPKIEGLLTPLTNGIQLGMDLFNKYKPDIIAFFAPVVDFVKQIVAGSGDWMKYLDIVKNLFLGHIWPVIQKLWNAVVDIVGKLVVWVMKSEILKDVFRLIAGFVGLVWNLVGWIIDKLKWLFDNIVMPLLDKIEKVYRWIKGTNGDIKVTGESKLIAAKTKSTAKSNSEVMAATAATAAGNTATAAGTGSSMSNGGPKTITITIQKVLDNINIHATTFENGLDEVESKVLETMSRVLGQSVAQAL